MSATEAPAPIDLSVVLVTFNSASEVGPCLASIKTAACELSIGVEIIVVDNASQDGTAELALMQVPEATVVSNRSNLGYARAMNIGLRLAHGTYILMLNPDTQVNADALRSCIAVLGNSSVGVTSPLLRYPDGRLQRNWYAFPTIRGALLDAIPGIGFLRALARRTAPPPTTPDWIMGAFMLTRADVLRRVGPLSERAFMFGEDLEWCARVRSAGYEVRLVPESHIVHIGGASTGRYYRPLARHMAVEEMLLRHVRRPKLFAALRLLASLQVLPAAYLLARAGSSRHWRQVLERRWATSRVAARCLLRPPASRSSKGQIKTGR